MFADQVSKGYAYLVPACALLIAPVLHAEEAIQPLETIQSTVHAFLMAQFPAQHGEPPEITLRPLDPRLRVAQCPVALEAFLPAGSRKVGAMSVGVRCAGAKPWTIYQTATVHVFAEVIVSSRFLLKGAVLGAADLRTERRDLGTLHSGYETTTERLLGMQLRRAIGAGDTLAARDVQPVLAVRRGDIVTVFSRSGGIDVSATGTALNDAAIGDRVRVRNDNSQRVVEGIATQARRVEISK